MEINLCEILKGHEGETFYSESLGNVKLHRLEPTSIILTVNKHKSIAFKCSLIDAQDDLFPSKDQRDWNKWDKENNEKTPKTWSKLIKLRGTKEYALRCQIVRGAFYNEVSYSPIEKSALALLKIHQLIEVGYGGIPTTDERIKNNSKVYDIDINNEGIFETSSYALPTNHVAFHTKEQAEEFLSYPENVQLLKDYFMIN